MPNPKTKASRAIPRPWFRANNLNSPICEMFDRKLMADPNTTGELQRLARARVELELAQRHGDLQRAGELMYGVIPDIERQLKDLPHAD